MNDTCICDNVPKVWRLTGVTRTLRLRIFNPDGTPLDLTGRTVGVTIARDNSEFSYAPGFVIEGDDNNVVKFEWPADKQGAGDYTINVTTTDGSGNVDRVNWHGPTGIRLVDFSFMVRGEDALGVTSEANIGLDGTFTMNGTGMSAYDEWLAEGHTGTPEEFIAWLRQPATDAASAAEAQMGQIQERADADHTRAGNDHTTAGQDHTRAGNDHTTATDDHRIAAADHSTATDDHTLAASDHATAEADHTQAASDHTQASSDHTTAEADHGIAASDHTAAAADHTQAGNDHSRAESDHTTASSDHSQAGTDHTRAEGDHATAGTDHTQAGSDHTTAAGDHTTAAADHTQAVADHAVMAGYDTRLGNVESEVSQLGQEVDVLQQETIVSSSLEYTTETLTWTDGLVNADGTSNSSSSYKHCNKFAVTPGQPIRLRKGDNSGWVVTAVRVCVYNGDTVLASKGGSDVSIAPYVVPEGATHLVFSLSTSYASSNPNARKYYYVYDTTFYKKTESDTANAALDAKIKTNTDSIDDLNLAVVDSWDDLTRTETLTWTSGIVSPQGVVSSNASYIYSNKFRVYEGDSIRIKKSNTAYIAEATRICAYNGETAIAERGGEDVSLPYTVPPGITHLIVTISASALSDNPYADIAYEGIVPKFYIKDETYTKTEVDQLLENTYSERIVVTQQEEIVSKEVQTVSTQIETVSSARNAANYGVLPSNDGTTNYTNLQALLDTGGTIYIDVPGIYEINGMLLIGSNTSLIFGQNVWMKKMNDNGGFIVNKGANTNTYNTDIQIVNLHLMCNGKGGGANTYRLGIRGQISFAYAKNIRLDGIYCDDNPNNAYFIHMCCWENVIIENCHIEGRKDGIHMATGKNLVIRNCYFATGDDPIALNCYDYNASIVEFGWIRNVVIEKCVDAPFFYNNAEVVKPRFALLFGGSWLDWASGNEYRNGDTIVSTNGYVYRLYMDSDTEGTLHTSTVAPTHDSGSATESDGCVWLFIQKATCYNCGCDNITFRDIELRRGRTQPFVFYYDKSKYCRSIYPGSITPPHTNITFENIKMYMETYADYLCTIQVPVRDIRIINSELSARFYFWVTNNSPYEIASSNNFLNLVLANNNIVKPDYNTNASILVLQDVAGRITNLKAYGDWIDPGYAMGNSVTGGTFNSITNDLWS